MAWPISGRSVLTGGDRNAQSLENGRFVDHRFDLKLNQSELAIPERFSNAVFHDPAFQVDRLPGRWRQLDTCGVFELSQLTIRVPDRTAGSSRSNCHGTNIPRPEQGS